MAMACFSLFFLIVSGKITKFDYLTSNLFLLFAEHRNVFDALLLLSK